ncbi:MAG: hypothetical protein ACYCZK_04920 [Microbacteriaceae bacterium]
MFSYESWPADAEAGSGILYEELGTHYALIEGVIRRFEDAARAIPLRTAEPDWHGLARRAFDSSVADLVRELDQARQCLQLAQWRTARAMDELSGRVR